MIINSHYVSKSLFPNGIPQTASEFASLSWDELKDISVRLAKLDDEKARQICDVWLDSSFTRKVNMDGGARDCRVVGINHYSRPDGTKSGLTFQLDKILPTYYAMTAKQADGYITSVLHNTTMPRIKSTMDDEVTKHMVEVVIPYNKYKGSGSGASAFTVEDMTTDFFIASCAEWFGNVSGSYNVGNDGYQLEYYAKFCKDSTSSTSYRTKGYYVWERSASYVSGNFLVVDTNGAWEDGSTATGSTTRGVMPCWCF